MKHSEFVSKIKTLTPANPALAFITEPVATATLHDALDISIDRQRELWLLFTATCEAITGDNSHISSDISLSVASYAAKSPQELVWLTYQIAKRGGNEDMGGTINARTGKVTHNSNMPNHVKEIIRSVLRKISKSVPDAPSPSDEKATASHKRVMDALKKANEAVEEHLMNV